MGKITNIYFSSSGIWEGQDQDTSRLSVNPLPRSHKVSPHCMLTLQTRKGSLWGLFYENTNLIQEDSTSMT